MGEKQKDKLYQNLGTETPFSTLKVFQQLSEERVFEMDEALVH